MLTDLQEAELLDRIAREVDADSRAALVWMLAELRTGRDAESVVAEALSRFEGAFVAELAAAMAAVTATQWTVNQLREIPLGFDGNPVKLSTRLYAHKRQTSAIVTNVIRQHVRGVQDARKLALTLYEGYGFRRVEDEPAQLAKQMPATIRQDAPLLQAYLQTIGRARVQQLRTPALRAAYLEALDAIEQGAAQKRLDRVLRTAFYERNRYFANRIAQTELHRAQAEQVDAELLAEPEIEYVQFRLSGGKREVDICDIFSRVDRFGLGPGVYPKRLAPKRPIHPFCRCLLVPRIDLTGTKEPKPRPNPDRAFLRGLDEREGRKIMGSEQMRLEVLTGKPAVDVINARREDGFKVRPISATVDVVRVGAASSRPVPNGYEIAKAGGPNSGLLENMRLNADAKSVASAVRSMDRQIRLHEQWIKDPLSKPGVENESPEAIANYVNKKWPKDIARHRAQREMFIGLLKEKTDGQGTGDS